MKRALRITVCAVSVVSVFLSMTGCFDRRELDTLGIVMGVGIDKAEKEGDIRLTIQMANPASQSSSKEAGGKSAKEDTGGGASDLYINLSGEGRNVNHIVREMQHEMSRRIYVAHSQVIVLGEELAREGVRDSLDFFARASEARMTLYMFVAGGEAGKVFDVSPEFEKMPSQELGEILKDQKITSNVPIVTEFEFVSKLVSRTTGAVAPLVEIINDNDRELIKLHGCAVFKESRMVGTFDDEQTRGLLFIENNVKTGVLNVDIDDASATIEIREADCKVKPVLYTDNTAEFNVNVEATVGLGDQTGTFNLSDPDNVGKMLGAAEDAIKAEIESAFEKSKELNSDVFGFGEYINRKYPDQWKEMESKWDELYKNIKVNINATAKADGSGRIIKPLVPKGS